MKIVRPVQLLSIVKWGSQHGQTQAASHLTNVIYIVLELLSQRLQPLLII